MTLRLNYRIYHRAIHIIIWVNTWLHIYLNLFNNTHIIIIFRELYASSPSAEQVQPLLHYLAINCIIIRRAKIVLVDLVVSVFKYCTLCTILHNNNNNCLQIGYRG